MQDLQTSTFTFTSLTQNSQLVLGASLVTLSPYLPDLGNQNSQLLQPIDESDIFLIDPSGITADSSNITTMHHHFCSTIGKI